MNEVLQEVLIQAGLYSLPMFATFFIISLMFRGFFFKYIKVRTSFGRLVLVKIRSQLVDHFEIGWVEEGFLCFKMKIDGKKEKLRFALPENEKIFYRCLGINWLDIDESTNGLSKTDYTAVSGYDPKKFSDLNTRALLSPKLKSNKEIIVILILCVIALLILIDLYFGYKSMSFLNALGSNLNTLSSGTKGIVTVNGV